MTGNFFDDPGLLYERRILNLMTLLVEKTVAKEHFSSSSDITLPLFEKLLTRVIIPPDGEIDILGVSCEATWVVEVKSRNRRMGVAEIRKLQKFQSLFENPRFWCVSAAGFTVEAKFFAQKHKILLSDGHAIETLERIIDR